MKVLFDKQSEWLRPYVKAAEPYVPVRRLLGVAGFRVALDKMEQADGRISTEDFRKFVITVRVQGHEWVHAGKGRFKATRHIPRTIEDILFTLAHELAHLKYWDHTPEHALLSARILQALYREARKQGVKDFQTGPLPKAKRSRRPATK